MNQRFSFSTRFSKIIPIAYLVTVCLVALASANDETDQAYQSLQKIPNGDDDLALARKSALALQRQPPTNVVETLKAMREATPIGRNWLAAVASSQWNQLLANKSQAESITPLLEEFLADQANDGEARMLVFNWLTKTKPELRKERLRTMTNDLSPEIRFAAIDVKLAELPDDAQAIDDLMSLLESARHPDQVRAIIKQLGKLDREIDQAQHFGFLKTWQLIGPFDNQNEQHFDTQYDVESDLVHGKFDSSKTYSGKSDQIVAWRTHTTNENEGKVDLAEIYNKEKGAIIYAYQVFNSPDDRTAEIRLTSINANKLWFNGKLILSNKVYHAGTRLDQYIGEIELKGGENEIVVKLLQNEQTDGWAQDFQFHARITDATGKAILSSP